MPLLIKDNHVQALLDVVLIMGGGQSCLYLVSTDEALSNLIDNNYPKLQDKLRSFLGPGMDQEDGRRMGVWVWLMRFLTVAKDVQ